MNARTTLSLAALTLAAGYGDAVAFFGLGVFTANMTGNTVLLGGALLARVFPHLPGVLPLQLPAISIACFVAGACAAALVLRGDAARSRPRTVALGGGAAALLTGAALLFGRHAEAGITELCVALLSSVMGIQSVLAERAGVPGVSTTYVTGTLVTAIVSLIGAPATAGKPRQAGVDFTAWALYLAGAVAGTAGLGVLGSHALWPAAVVVALLIAVL
jgi:uncharacterized membrane protein YoaK (UPF0700 family)